MFGRKKVTLTNEFLKIGDARQFTKEQQEACKLLDSRTKSFLENYPIWLASIDSASKDVSGFNLLSYLCKEVWMACYPSDGLFIAPIPGKDIWFYSKPHNGVHEIKPAPCTFELFPNYSSEYVVEKLASTSILDVIMISWNSQTHSLHEWITDGTDWINNVDGQSGPEDAYCEIVEEFQKNLENDLEKIYFFVLKIRAELGVHGIGNLKWTFSTKNENRRVFRGSAFFYKILFSRS